LEFLDETYATEIRGMGLPYGVSVNRVTDGLKDGWAIAYGALSRLEYYSVAR